MHGLRVGDDVNVEAECGGCVVIVFMTFCIEGFVLRRVLVVVIIRSRARFLGWVYGVMVMVGVTSIVWTWTRAMSFLTGRAWICVEGGRR